MDNVMPVADAREPTVRNIQARLLSVFHHKVDRPDQFEWEEIAKGMVAAVRQMDAAYGEKSNG